MKKNEKNATNVKKMDKKNIKLKVVVKARESGLHIILANSLFFKEIIYKWEQISAKILSVLKNMPNS